MSAVITRLRLQAALIVVSVLLHIPVFTLAGLSALLALELMWGLVK